MTVDFTLRQRPYAGTGIDSYFVPSPNGLSYHAIRYGNGAWIALAVNGAGNQITKSVDGGDNWASRAEPGARQWTGLCYCGARHWVGVAQNGVAAGQAMYSDDNGETWSAATMPVAIAWQDCCYGNGVVVAVANAGLITQQVARSTDYGHTWALATGGAAALRQWNSVAYGDGVFIAVAYDGVGDQTMWSNDGGDNWNSVAEAVTMQWDGVRYDGKSRWVAVAYQSAANNVQYSDDNGQSWTQGIVSGAIADWAEVAYGNNSWCAVAGNVGQLGFSRNGIAFRRIPWCDNTNMYAIDYGGDRFIACGNTYFQIS